MSNTSQQLILAARELSAGVDRLKFAGPVTQVYNPLDYARAAHEKYLSRFGSGRKRVVFMGMNPGPFGMAQTGVPFGEIAAVRDWMGITAPIGRPRVENPKRVVRGFDCPNSEVSGRRLWGLFNDRFGSPEHFFKEHFVTNYCPLVFMKSSGSNFTPDKLPPVERDRLMKLCDEHLRRVLEILEPAWLIGVGAWARKRGELVADGTRVQIGQILHPSPASPKANRGWATIATQEMIQLGIWK